MPTQKLPDALVKDILRLAAEDMDAASIARELNLLRMEVAAILAHQTIGSAASDGAGEMDAATGVDESLEIDTKGIDQPMPVSSAQDEAEDSLGEIYIGEEIEYSTPAYWSPSHSKEVQNPHLMIMGESGSGKTYAAQCIVAELAHAGIPTVIFDYGQSFESGQLEQVFVDYCAPREYLIGEVGLGLNPLEVFSQDVRGPSSVATRLSDVFDAAFRLGDIQRMVFIEAAMQAYRKAGIDAGDKSTWSKPPPELSALNEAINRLASDREGYAHHRNAAGLSARLTPFFMLVSFHSERWSWDALMSKEARDVHILQFRGLEGKTRRVLVELLLWHMFYHFKSTGQGGLRLCCVLDEAHHLSFREGGPMDALLREARKFGIGIIFASQQPQDFSPVAYANTASKLVFQTADPGLKVSKFLSSKCVNYDRPEEIHELIASLEQGNAFFITQNRGYTIRVSDFRMRSTQWGRQ